MRPIIFSPVSDHNMPSSYYRVYKIAEHMKQRGFRISILNPYFSDSEKRAFLYAIEEPSIIYIQKNGNSFHTPDNISPLKDKHIIVFDCDDFINLDTFHDMIGTTDNIVCGSHFLFEYVNGFNKNAALIECCIDEKHFIVPTIREERKLPRIVWSQSYADEYAPDLLSIAQVLQELHLTLPFELLLVGFRTDSIQKEVQKKLPFATLIPFKPLDIYFRETLPMIQQADIGIVPLLDIDSRRGKAGLTLRNYLLMGIPSVASGIGEHPHIIVNDVNGFLASSPEEWHRYLMTLLTDKQKRSAISSATHQSIAQKYSLSSRVDALIDFLHLCEHNSRNPSFPHVNNQHNTATILLMRIKENELPENSVAALSIRNIPLIKYIELLLMETGLLTSVVIALPDTPIHRDYADVLRQYGMTVFIGNPDNPDVRFIEAIPENCTYALRLTIEKPFVDSETLSHLVNLLKEGYHCAQVNEPHWGTYIQAYRTDKLKSVAHHFTEQRTAHLWDYLLSLPETKSILASQLYKPIFTPISIDLESRKGIAQFIKYVNLTNHTISVKEFITFCITRINEKKSALYKHIKTQKKRINSSGKTCYILGQTTQRKAVECITEQSLICYPPQRDHDISDGINTQCCDFLVPYGSEEYDYALFNVQKWCLENNINKLIALGNDTIVFTVRLSILLNIPVSCYPDKQPDPADWQLLHHLNMADEVVNHLSVSYKTS
ncbi:MAG: glycosyltransferase [bacterium]|nr:glycosyltransferase [bacterium]